MRSREFVSNGRAIVAVRHKDGTETVHDRPARITARRIVVDPVSRLTFDRVTGAWLDSAEVRIRLGKPRRVLCYQFDGSATVVRSTPRPVHAACLGVDADLLAACKAANSAMSWMLNARLQSVHRNPNELFATVAALRAAIARAERATTSRGTARRGELTITDEPTGTDAPTQGDDHAE